MAEDNIEKIESSSIQLSSKVMVVGSAIIATPQVSHIQILVVDNKIFWESLETACKAAGWVAVVIVAVAIYRSVDPSKWKDNPFFCLPSALY